MSLQRNFMCLVFVGTSFVVFIVMSDRGHTATHTTPAHHNNYYTLEQLLPNFEQFLEDLSSIKLTSDLEKRVNTYRERMKLHIEKHSQQPGGAPPNLPVIASRYRLSPGTLGILLGETGHHADNEEPHPEYHRDADNKTSKSETGSNAVAAYRKIDRTSQPIVEPKPLGDTHARVFKWNDQDPDGWRTLPLSLGEPGEKWERIFYNRVPKCGSRSVTNLLRNLAKRNHFNMISSIVYKKHQIPAKWEEHIVSVLDKVETPYLYDRHLHYVSFERHNASEVVYINIIRDPVSRMVSHYYFTRFGDEQVKFSSSRRTEKETNESIDECVKNNHQDCSGSMAFLIIPFFCGNLNQCMKPSRWALDRAIHNVEKHFIVVGILEEFDLTLRVFERMLPRFFAGATELYHTTAIQEHVSKTSTSRKIPPSNETVAILRERMKYEYIFYNFVKDRLHKQAEILDS